MHQQGEQDQRDAAPIRFMSAQTVAKQGRQGTALAVLKSELLNALTHLLGP